MIRHPFPVSDHCDGRVFFNPDPVEHRLADLWRWRRTHTRSRWHRVTDFDPAPPPPRRVQGLRITWINHATVLLQVDRLNVLTDPIWSNRAGPLPWLGARRYHPPGIRFEDLPEIDLVLISHAHYDHLDRPTLRRLIDAHEPACVAPLGLQCWLRRAGAHDITALDWWQAHALTPHLTLHATPARHWSRRTLLDRNRSLWCGYYLETPHGNIYFAGDTGMGDHFAAIRSRLGAPRVALLPIGAYEPRWFMQAVHMSPADAIEAHRILQAERSIGVHFGTFKLSDEGQDAPAEEMMQARRRAGLPPAAFCVPAFGESPIGSQWNMRYKES